MLSMMYKTGTFTLNMVSIYSLYKIKDIGYRTPYRTQEIDENRVSEGFWRVENTEKLENPGKWRIWRKYPKMPKIDENRVPESSIYGAVMEFPEKKVRKFPKICRKSTKIGVFSTVLRGAETTKMGKVPPDPPEFRWAFVRPRT